MKNYFLGIVFLFFVTPSFPACQEWGEPYEIGSLKYPVNESSGIAISKKFQDRIYHINDSGDGPNFYQTDSSGKDLIKITIKNFSPIDVEALAYKTFSEIGPTLIIGDIGDNSEQRDSVQLVFIKELKDFGNKVAPYLILNIRYPDGARNSESFDFTPEGDLILITKEIKPKIYIVRASIISQQLKLVKEGSGNETLNRSVGFEYVGELNIPYLGQINNVDQRGLITDLNISWDSKDVVLMTYEDAIYFDWEEFRKYLMLDEQISRVSSSFPKHTIIKLKHLLQQEAVSLGNYSNSGKGNWIIYTSESLDNLGSQEKEIMPSSPILKVECLN